MFECHTEDDLISDEFETDSKFEEDDSSVAFDIENLATSFIGEHECVFSEIPAGFQKPNLKLMVTTEANANTFTRITSKTEFKAEIIVERGTMKNTKIDDDIYINCPNSGNLSAHDIQYAFTHFVS